MEQEYKDLNPIEEIIDKDDENRILSDLAKIDGLHEYLRALLARDLRNHFNCQKAEQDLVRGGYFRTEWLAKKIKSHSIDNK